MSALVESALDLSAKPECVSPAPSLSPEPSSMRHPGSQTPERVSDSDGSFLSAPSSTVKTPMSSSLPPQLHAGFAQLAGAMSAMAAGNGAFPMPPSPTNGEESSNGGQRPFKMYPFEGMSPAMYSQLAAAAASTGTGGLSPFTAAQAAMPFGLFDSGISLTSPIGQYLQSRKRRAETRPPASSSPAGPEKRSRNPSDDNNSQLNLSGGESKDDAYWERRRKNNEAAKRSRDSRRAKEEEIALRAAFLEQENLKLRAQVAILKNETAKLHYMLYNRM